MVADVEGRDRGPRVVRGQLVGGDGDLELFPKVGVCNGSKLTEGKYANIQSNLVYLGQAKRLQSVMTSLTRYRIFDHSPWQKHRNYFILRSEHLE